MRLQLGLWLLVPLVLASPARGEPVAGDTRITSDVLVYVDDDNVSIVSPQVGARHAIDEDGGEVSARVVLDAITAASVDVVSNATYRFSELRSEVNVGASKAAKGFLPSVSYRLSHEPDYVSHGFGASLSKELAGGDSTVSGGYNLVVDTVGRVDTPKSVFAKSLQSHSFEAGITQVLDTKSLLRAVYTMTAQNGYMEKPYRSVAVFDAAALRLLADNDVILGLNNFDMHRLAFKPAEEVPDTRYRHAAALRGLRFVDALDASLRIDYRLYGDSWGMYAHTAEIAVAKSLFSGLRLDTWGRFHYQNGVDFWRRTYAVDNAMSIPSLRTTDKSLSPYWQSTMGVRVQYTWGHLRTYLQTAAMHSSFLDHLYIDSRNAIITQGGVRWGF